MSESLENNKKQEASILYLALAGVFIALLVSCNLIFNKFIIWNPFGIYEFNISVGLIPYPLTFLVTDIISEIYGKKKANNVVKIGLLTSVLVLIVVGIGDSAVATINSPVNDETFSTVFGFAKYAVAASMAAYLIAQFVDIRIFHYLKKKTNGKHLWLRNNVSTIFSQLLDTSIVLSLLCVFDVLPWFVFLPYFISGFLFKLIFALFDTPLIYLCVWLIRKRFNLKGTEELSSQ